MSTPRQSRVEPLEAKNKVKIMEAGSEKRSITDGGVNAHACVRVTTEQTDLSPDTVEASRQRGDAFAELEENSQTCVLHSSDV